jgi:hypothetical protein
MKKPQTSDLWILLPDIHHPEHCEAAIKAVLSFIERNKNKIKGVVLTGDNMDCVNISRHTEGKPRLRTRGGIAKDFDNFNKDILLPIEAHITKETAKWIFLGNHEDWLEQWLDKNPEFEDLVSFDKNLNLTQRGWKVIPQGEHRQIGKAYILHGDQIGSSMHVAKKLVDSFCATAVMSHVHQYSAYTKVSQVKAKDKWIGITLPTLGTVSPKYAKGRPNAFLNGFGIVELWKNDFVNIYVPIIFNGCFSFGGELYEG